MTNNIVCNACGGISWFMRQYITFDGTSRNSYKCTSCDYESDNGPIIVLYEALTDAKWTT